VTPNAVLASPEHGLKASLRSPLMFPRVAIVDPLLTMSCPPSVTASSGMDALTQCLEALVSIRATPMTDALASEACDERPPACAGAMPMAPTWQPGPTWRCAACSAGCHSRTPSWARARPGRRDRRHDRDPTRCCVCALLLATIEANVKALRTRQPDGDALARYEQVARLLTGRVDATIEQGAVWIEETVRLLGQPSWPATDWYQTRSTRSSQERSSRAAPRATRSNCAPKSCVAC